MDPFIVVIFGASGDLTQRKLLPSLFALYRNGYLPEHFAVLGVSRTAYSDEAWREMIFTRNDFIDRGDCDEKQVAEFGRRLYYETIDTGEQADYARVKERLQAIDDEQDTRGNYLFYLSVPPFLYSKIPAYLNHHGLTGEDEGWRRVIIEKPFGNDEASARELNRQLCSYLREDQIYRIDHYLGKETVQNMLVTRFANPIFEPLWNRNYVRHIEITSAEDIGVEKRGGYYDQSGALRDMVQNHLLQVLAHVAMEPPTTADAKYIRNEKMKLFESIRPIPVEKVDQYVVRGQYIGSEIDGQAMSSYREEEGVPADSQTETFVALKCHVDNWRWAGVPFFIRTGKRLPTKVTQVTVVFKQPPHHLFMAENGLKKEANKLIMRIQPDEGLALQFGMKVPGAGFKVKDVSMDFHYSDLTAAYVPEAYERLLMDCIKGDPTLYARGDSVEAAWRFIDPIVEAWNTRPDIELHGYPSGTWGPEAAEALFGKSPLRWHNPCPSLTTAYEDCTL